MPKARQQQRERHSFGHHLGQALIPQSGRRICSRCALGGADFSPASRDRNDTVVDYKEYTNSQTSNSRNLKRYSFFLIWMVPWSARSRIMGPPLPNVPVAVAVRPLLSMLTLKSGL